MPFTAIACPTATECVGLADDVLVAGPQPAAISPQQPGTVRLTLVKPGARGIAVKLTCGRQGPCTVNLTLAAGLANRAAAQRVLTLRASHSAAVLLTLVPAARRLLAKDHTLGGVLTVAETTASGQRTVATRRITIHA